MSKEIELGLNGGNLEYVPADQRVQDEPNWLLWLEGEHDSTCIDLEEREYYHLKQVLKSGDQVEGDNQSD